MYRASRIRRILKRTGLAFCLLIVAAFVLSTWGPVLSCHDISISEDSLTQIQLSKGTLCFFSSTSNHRWGNGKLCTLGFQRPSQSLRWLASLTIPSLETWTTNSTALNMVTSNCRFTLPLWIPLALFLIPTVALKLRDRAVWGRSQAAVAT